MKYSNPWNGNTQFYKGKKKKLSTAETDKEYQAYCKRKKNKDKILGYKSWCAKQKKQHGMF